MVYNISDFAHMERASTLLARFTVCSIKSDPNQAQMTCQQKIYTKNVFTICPPNGLYIFQFRASLHFKTKHHVQFLLYSHFRVDPKKTIQTKVVTVTQTLVDGKVVSESQDVKASEKVV